MGMFQDFEQGTIVFGDIRALDQQFHRLSALEKQLMYCLASYRECVKLPKLVEYIVPTVSYGEEALESLHQRSLRDTQIVLLSNL